MKVAATLVLGITLATAVQAADLTTRSGKVYHDYRVVSHDAGYVTILDSDGGGRVPLADLPADLQKQFGYDPAQAASFVSQFKASDKQQQSAVVQAEASALDAQTKPAESTQDSKTVASSGAAPPDDDAASDETAASGKSDLSGGFDPLAPGAEVLHTQESAANPYETSDVAVDSSGEVWVSSVDAEGMVHWYPRGTGHVVYGGRDSYRVDGNDNIPDGSVVTRDHSGHWIVTYVDSHGTMHRRMEDGSHLRLAGGVWRIRIDQDGHRVATRDSTEGHPQGLHFVQFTSNGGSHVYTGTASPGFTSSRTTFTPSNQGGVTHSSYSSGSYSSGSAPAGSVRVQRATTTTVVTVPARQ